MPPPRLGYAHSQVAEEEAWSGRLPAVTAVRSLLEAAALTQQHLVQGHAQQQAAAEAAGTADGRHAAAAAAAAAATSGGGAFGLVALAVAEAGPGAVASCLHAVVLAWPLLQRRGTTPRVAYARVSRGQPSCCSSSSSCAWRIACAWG